MLGRKLFRPPSYLGQNWGTSGSRSKIKKPWKVGFSNFWLWSRNNYIPKFVLSGFYPGVSDREKIHIISDPVQIMATALAWCIRAVDKIYLSRKLFEIFSIRDLSRFYPEVSDRQKIHIISDSIRIMATALAWCINAVMKIWTKSEIIRNFFYPCPMRVISGNLGLAKNPYSFRLSSNNGNCIRVVHKCSSQDLNWIGNYSIFFSIRVLSGIYPGSIRESRINKKCI